MKYLLTLTTLLICVFACTELNAVVVPAKGDKMEKLKKIDKQDKSIDLLILKKAVNVRLVN